MRTHFWIGGLLAGAQLAGCGDGEVSAPAAGSAAVPPVAPWSSAAAPGASQAAGVPGTAPGVVAAPGVVTLPGQAPQVGAPAGPTPGVVDVPVGQTPAVTVTEQEPAAPAGPAKGCDPDQFLAPRVVRLTHDELRSHIQDTLPGVDMGLMSGVEFQAGHLAPANARGLSGAEFGLYFSAAKKVANSFVADSADLEPCRAEAASTACLDLLEPIVGKLYHRPATAAEWAKFLETFGTLSTELGTEEAATAVLTGALIAPQTLHRTEAGETPHQAGTFRITQREVLSLARYALTGSGPTDEELTLIGQSPEMFDQRLSEFAAQWSTTADFTQRMVDLSEKVFGVQFLSAVQRVEDEFTPEVKSAMSSEFRNFVEAEFLAPGGRFENLFLNNPAEHSPELEEIYEDDDKSPTGQSPRQGILGLPGLLTALGGSTSSDPVKRGVLVRELLLCESLPPPVEGADFDLVDVTEDMQTRERFEALATTGTCASCHQVINPPGYLFENFDHLGRYRVEEKGRPVNAVSTITPPFGRDPYVGVEEWDGVVPLAEWLAQSPDARRCFAKNFASFVLSDAIPYNVNNCSMDSVASRFVETGLVADLVADVVRSPLFTHRTREVQQ